MSIKPACPPFPTGLERLERKEINHDEPVLLFKAGNHAVYWLGHNEETAFRCNIYLIKNNDEGIIIDPGWKNVFGLIKKQAIKIMPLQQIKGMILSHQDPDVASAMPDWLALNPGMRVFSSPRTHVLLRYYAPIDYQSHDVEQQPVFRFSSDSELHFITAPFMHAPGAFATYDATSGYLLSGDIWSAINLKRVLVVDNFTEHVFTMDLFNKDYMAGNLAARGFIHKLKPYTIQGILPQHGSIIPKRSVKPAIDYLWNLECGTDLLYLESSFYGNEPEGFPPETEHNYTDTDLGNGKTDTDELEPETGNTRMNQAIQQATRMIKFKDEILRQLKATTKRLQESEACLSEAQSIAKLGHWDWNIQTNDLDWSDEIYRIFGLKPQEFGATYEAFLQSVHPDDRDRVVGAVNRAVSEDEPYKISHQVVRPDGEVRFVYEQGNITRGKNGEPLRMLGIVHDITELKLAEKALHSKNMLINAIQNMQAQFITRSTPFSMYQGLLDDLINLTDSEYGFIGEVNHSPEGAPYLVLYALSNLSWNEETRKLYDEKMGEGFEFHNFKSLLGYALTSGKPVISDNPSEDPRGCGFPAGHPEISTFLGIPVYFGDRLVGQIGLANRKGGYRQEVVSYLEPLIDAYGQIIVARQDQQARTTAEEVLSRLAKMDGLLGIPNRRSFDEYIEQQHNFAIRQELPLSLILLDVDHFKRFNDRYGHQAGDACLVEIAGIIQESLLRPSDMVARYGGEEFCCILPGTNTEGAITVGERIRAKLEEKWIPHADSPVSDRVTVSIGIAFVDSGNKTTVDELIAFADKALYKAKSSGRDCVKVNESTGQPKETVRA